MAYVEVNWNWVEDQLKKAGLTRNRLGKNIKDIIDTLEDSRFTTNELKDLEKTLQYAGSLFSGHPIVVDTDNENWVDLRGGDLVVRDTVRVKPDAYTGLSGSANNGKRGRVTAMRNGKVTVVYDGDPIELAKSHDIPALQKLDVE